MQFKKGYGWKACYDEESGRYFGEYGGIQEYHLYELTKEQYDALDKKMSERAFRSPFFRIQAASNSQNEVARNTKQRKNFFLYHGLILRADRVHILASPSFTVNVLNDFSPACIK